MLEKIADFYDDEVDAAVDALTALLEPLMMVFLGGTVGGMLIAMYLPIFKIAETRSSRPRRMRRGARGAGEPRATPGATPARAARLLVLDGARGSRSRSAALGDRASRSIGVGAASAPTQRSAALYVAVALRFLATARLRGACCRACGALGALRGGQRRDRRRARLGARALLGRRATRSSASCTCRSRVYGALLFERRGRATRSAVLASVGYAGAAGAGRDGWLRRGLARAARARRSRALGVHAGALLLVALLASTLGARAARTGERAAPRARSEPRASCAAPPAHRREPEERAAHHRSRRAASPRSTRRPSASPASRARDGARPRRSRRCCPARGALVDDARRGRASRARARAAAQRAAASELPPRPRRVVLRDADGRRRRARS